MWDVPEGARGDALPLACPVEGAVAGGRKEGADAFRLFRCVDADGFRSVDFLAVFDVVCCCCCSVAPALAEGS